MMGSSLSPAEKKKKANIQHSSVPSRLVEKNVAQTNCSDEVQKVTATQPILETDWDARIVLIRNQKDFENLLERFPPHDSFRDQRSDWFNARIAAEEQEGKQLHQALSARATRTQSINQSKQIKTPAFRIVDDELARSPYDYTNHYLKSCVYRDYVQPLKLSNGDHVHYDITLADLKFLSKLAHSLSLSTTETEENVPLILEENFIRLIHQFENNTSCGPPITFEVGLGIARSLPSIGDSIPVWGVQMIYQHWISRRAAVQKPLLRRFWGSSGAAPYAVFQTKLQTKSRMALRRPKRSLQEAASKFETVPAELRRVEKLLKLMIRRDRQKLLIAELNGCIFDQFRREIEDPTYINPHWLHLKRSRFDKIAAFDGLYNRNSLVPSKRVVDKWLDTCNEGGIETITEGGTRGFGSPSMLLAEYSGATSYILGDLEPITVCGGGKSVPGGAALQSPFFHTLPQFQDTEARDSSQATYLCTPLDPDGKVIVQQSEPTGFTDRAAVYYEEGNLDRFLTVYQAEGSVDPAPPKCSMAGTLLENRATSNQYLHTLHQWRMLSLLNIIHQAETTLKRSTNVSNKILASTNPGSNSGAPSGQVKSRFMSIASSS